MSSAAAQPAREGHTAGATDDRGNLQVESSQRLQWMCSANMQTLKLKDEMKHKSSAEATVAEFRINAPPRH